MYRKIFISIFLLCDFLRAMSQLSPKEIHVIDSLKILISYTKQDTLRIKAYKDWDNLIFTSNQKLDDEINQKIIDISQNNLNKNTLSDGEKVFFKKTLSFGYKNKGVINTCKLFGKK